MLGGVGLNEMLGGTDTENEMEISEGTKQAVAAVNKVMEMPADQRQDYLEMLGHAATKYMRAFGGEDYVRGYLQAAIDELDGPPLFELRKPQ